MWNVKRKGGNEVTKNRPGRRYPIFQASSTGGRRKEKFEENGGPNKEEKKGTMKKEGWNLLLHPEVKDQKG